MNKFTSASAAILLVACIGTDLSVSIADALINPEDPSIPGFCGTDGGSAAYRPAKATTTTASSSDSTDACVWGGRGNDGRCELTHVSKTAD